ncbi:MAG TPA: hypothetical protein VL326_38815 [Kofleriaceae bacterium]|nr:hypothetical protein [Kofleriaceae bacterium]
MKRLATLVTLALAAFPLTASAYYSGTLTSVTTQSLTQLVNQLDAQLTAGSGTTIYDDGKTYCERTVTKSNGCTTTQTTCMDKRTGSSAWSTTQTCGTSVIRDSGTVILNGTTSTVTTSSYDKSMM